MQSLSWQQQIAQAIRRPEELLEHVGLISNALGYSESALKQFPMLVPHAYADRIKHNDPDDPLLRQVFPYLDEEVRVDGFVNDPLNELDVQPAPGLLQKYQGRVLAITTGACAIHCRYCFRRHFPYQGSSATNQQWHQALEIIQSDKSISEIILSGGDPLTLSDQGLIALCKSIVEIKHIRRIRFHTRIPVILPDRLNEDLVKKLGILEKSIVFVLHINHANEIDQRVEANIRLLQKYNIMVLNQSVLLKGVNDNADTLIELSEMLVKNNVAPYYLHLLDPVAGASHFNVDENDARKLILDMSNKVSGYLVPKLVKEEASAKSKTHLSLSQT